MRHVPSDILLETFDSKRDAQRLLPEYAKWATSSIALQRFPDAGVFVDKTTHDRYSVGPNGVWGIWLRRGVARRSHRKGANND